MEHDLLQGQTLATYALQAQALQSRFAQEQTAQGPTADGVQDQTLHNDIPDFATLEGNTSEANASNNKGNLLSAKPMLRQTNAQSNPAFALKNDVFKYAGLPQFTAYQYTICGDGSLWAQDGGTMYLYSVVRGGWGKIDMPKPRGTNIKGKWFSPFDAKTVYYIGRENNSATAQSVYRFSTIDGTTKLPDLPQGMPCSVVVANDGTVWAVNESDKIFSLTNGTSWTPIAPFPDAGVKLHTLSVGNSNFAMAITIKMNQYPINYRYKDGAWTATTSETFTPGASFVSACSDGSYWLQMGRELIHRVEKSATEINSTSLFIPEEFWRPEFTITLTATRNACFFAVLPYGIYCAALGVIDDKATGWPAMTEPQKRAYEALSGALGIIDAQGIRLMYPNKSAVLQNYINRIGTLARPSTVDENMWKWITDLIKEELQYAIDASNFFVNVENLNTQIYLATLSIYNEVLPIIGLPPEEKDQPPTIIDVALTKLGPKIESLIAEKLPQISQVMTVMSQVNNISAILVAEKKGAKDTSRDIQIKCSELATTLLDVKIKMMELTAQYRDSVLTNGNKLRAVGQALTSGLWYWPSDFDVTTIKNMGAPIRINMYQSLMPVRYMIGLVQTILVGNPMPTNAPDYTWMYKTNGSGYWFSMVLGHGAEISQRTTGPFPPRELMKAIFNLVGDPPVNFFTSKNGWNLRIEPMGGYLPPQPPDLPWRPYAKP